jgi:hypothetical protein
VFFAPIQFRHEHRSQIFVFLPEGQGYPERPLLNHTTLGRSRSYQGMSEHHEATTGAIGNNALCAAMAYGHNEFSGAEVLVKS